VVLSYWHKTKCHSSLDSALHKIAWYGLESLATTTKKTIVARIFGLLFPTDKVTHYFLEKMDWVTFLGEFFANSSCHPACHT
jgi:hypothetical protein